jgi:hypothetical protein
LHSFLEVGKTQDLQVNFGKLSEMLLVKSIRTKHGLNCTFMVKVVTKLHLSDGISRSKK